MYTRSFSGAAPEPARCSAELDLALGRPLATLRPFTASTTCCGTAGGLPRSYPGFSRSYPGPARSNPGPFRSYTGPARSVATPRDGTWSPSERSRRSRRSPRSRRPFSPPPFSRAGGAFGREKPFTWRSGRSAVRLGGAPSWSKPAPPLVRPSAVGSAVRGKGFRARTRRGRGADGSPGLGFGFASASRTPSLSAATPPSLGALSPVLSSSSSCSAPMFACQATYAELSREA